MNELRNSKSDDQLEELVKKLPVAEVDDDGNVKINGKELKKIMGRKDRRVTTADRNRYRAKKGYIKVYSDCREIQHSPGL